MSYRSTNPKGAKALLDDESHTLVDVRTVEEFDAGHVPGAYNIPFAFRSPLGMQPNPEFGPALERAFGKEAKLVLL